MSKNIIICSDGTGNRGGKTFDTNVRRIFLGLDRHGVKPQIAYYDDGVGTEDNKYLKALSGAFGYGFSENVRQAYRYLCLNYQEDDQIAMFGFSRGAYTVRALAAFVTEMGLVDVADLPDQSERHLKEAIEQRTKDYFHRRKTKVYHQEGPDIAFLGVWDTVSAVAGPADLPFRTSLLKWRFKYYFHDKKLSSKVTRACHALALDDQRKTFHPEVWEARDDGTIEQVWFPGMHSDVGGGYPKNGLAYVTLKWMLSRIAADPAQKDAGNHSLIFTPGFLEEVHNRADAHDKMYDSRSGLAAFYRYAPRDITALCGDQIPLVHKSVYERMAKRTQAYAPGNIPTNAKVVNDTSQEPQQPPLVTIQSPDPKHVGFRMNLHLAFLFFFLTTAAWLGATSGYGKLSFWLTVGITMLLFRLGWSTLPGPWHKMLHLIAGLAVLASLATSSFPYQPDRLQLPPIPETAAKITCGLVVLGMVVHVFLVYWLSLWRKLVVAALPVIAFLTAAKPTGLLSTVIGFLLPEAMAGPTIAFAQSQPWLMATGLIVLTYGLFLRGVLKRRCIAAFEQLMGPPKPSRQRANEGGNTT